MIIKALTNKNLRQLFPFAGRVNLWHALFLAGQTASYFLAGWILSRFSLGWWSPQSSWDGLIRFLPFMILPYALYFPVMAAPLFPPMQKTGAKRLMFCLIAASAICYLASWTSDVSVSPRASLEGRSGFFVSLTAALYKYDISPVHFPSLHSLHSLLIGFHLWRAGGVWRLCLPCAGLITASTVFVKQHFVWDSIASLLLAPAIYGAAALLIRERDDGPF